MIEEDSADGKNPARAINFAQAVCGRLRDPVRRSGRQRSLLVAQSIKIAIHLRAGCLVDAGTGLLALDDVEQSRQAAYVDVKSFGGNLPARWHKNLSRKVIDFVW